MKKEETTEQNPFFTDIKDRYLFDRRNKTAAYIYLGKQ